MRLSAVVPRFKALGLRFYCLHYGVDGVNLSPDQSDSDFFTVQVEGLTAFSRPLTFRFPMFTVLVKEMMPYSRQGDLLVVLNGPRSLPMNVSTSFHTTETHFKELGFAILLPSSLSCWRSRIP